MNFIEQIFFFLYQDRLCYTIDSDNLDRVNERHRAGLYQWLRVTLSDLDDAEVSVKGLQGCNTKILNICYLAKLSHDVLLVQFI